MRIHVIAAAVILLGFAGRLVLPQDGSPPQVEQLPKPPPAQGGGSVPRQEQNEEPTNAVPQERWNLFWQATSIGQYHGTFSSPYADPKYSLQNYDERVVSLTTTLFFGFRLHQNT